MFITLTAVSVVSTAPGFCNCYTEAIVPQGGAFDAVYRTGSLLQHKLHFQAPLNSLEANCGSILKLAGYLNTGGILSTLPSFMSIDEANRALNVYIPVSDDTPYLN